MATLSITIGTLTSEATTADDTAAAEVLTRFAHAVGADPLAAEQEKLDLVVARLTAYMLAVARERYVQEESGNIREEAETLVHW